MFFWWFLSASSSSPNTWSIISMRYAIETNTRFACLPIHSRERWKIPLLADDRANVCESRDNPGVSWWPIVFAASPATILIMDNAPPNVFACAADVVTLDGYAVNKVGTFQLAMAAHYHKIPCYILRNPSLSEPHIKDVKIEMRNPEESLKFLDIRTVKEGVTGFYPAFDITPPTLISGVVTSKGVFSPFDLHNHFEAVAETVNECSWSCNI